VLVNWLLKHPCWLVKMFQMAKRIYGTIIGFFNHL